MSASTPLFLEDLHPGQKFPGGQVHLDLHRMKAFAAEFDPQPFHLDETAAQNSIFRGLAGSGWHTAALAIRLLVDGGLPFAYGLIGLGGEIAWPHPTRPGDTLTLESEILDLIPSRSKPQQGIALVRCTMTNQDGKSVYIFTVKILVHRRPVPV